MWTGRQTLASIEDAMGKLHGEQSQLDQALRSAVGETPSGCDRNVATAAASSRASSSTRWPLGA
mgnify:CR=1 FL=1